MHDADDLEEPRPAPAFAEAVARLQAWAATIPEDARGGEWECNYGDWHEIYAAWTKLVATAPVESWEPALIDAALFAIARDNENQALARELPRAALPVLTEHATARGEPDAKWQLAHELGEGPRAAVETLLLRLADDEDEYVRRRALQSLARIGAAGVTELALREWERAPDEMPWSRMNALWALHRVSSPSLSSRLEEALASPNELLRDYARKVRAGDVHA